MSRKSKGINAERELIHQFWSRGWAAARIAGSGAIKYPSADIIAGTPARKLVIECKSIKDSSFYFSKQEIENLKRFAGLFGAEPWIGIRFSGKRWYFFNPEDLRETEKSMMISAEQTITKGLLFEEMTG